MIKVAVIGGGASGLACAIEIMHTVKNRDDVKVTVFEKLSRIGKKILVTGNGRCNITNMNAVKSGFRGDVEFSEYALNKYTPESNIVFFNGLGLYTRQSSCFWQSCSSELAREVREADLRCHVCRYS